MRALVASLALLTALPLTAQAQEAMPEMPVASISETETAQPDWFHQFTFSQDDIESPVWQTQPSRNIGLAFVEGEKWSLRVDMTSRDERSPLAREEMTAGANFRITPRISVGGEFSIGADELDDTTKWQEQQLEAGIRLRSAFKF